MFCPLNNLSFYLSTCFWLFLTTNNEFLPLYQKPLLKCYLNWWLSFFTRVILFFYSSTTFGYVNSAFWELGNLPINSSSDTQSKYLNTWYCLNMELSSFQIQLYFYYQSSCWSAHEQDAESQSPKNTNVTESHNLWDVHYKNDGWRLCVLLLRSDQS